ncbi:MalY/PatB family protein [Azospira restricta]|uniref:cysteine-S-conjugate beta-lyase n=1 Tax=Azospira restricta TaxID=404405 RepID=A0A974Y478_9RHOO|nr:PatB family C-S lyase [Azospira restricta]QRJ64324.1 PatB family C-S lyase [Azospira restricta]
MSDPFGFDRVVDFAGGDSVKWNRYAGSDVLPLWIADMDFAAPPAVTEALQQRVAQGVFGYAEPSPALVAAVLGHLEREYGWRIDADWLVWLPGLVSGLNIACRAVADGVLTATPVYPPFLSAPRFAGRPLATVPLVHDGRRWTWDWSALEAATTAETRLLLLCHPHNPVGRAWDERELAELAAFCRRHELVVCSDEIHCDLVLDDRRHRPWATLGDDLAARSITLMAPSKTFNVPGLGCAFAVIPDAALRRAFTRAMAGIVPHVNALGFVACAAAYAGADDWRQALLAVLRRNRDRVEAAVAALPPLAMTHVEATYLAWIDVRGLELLHPQRHFEAHGLGLSDGADFGAPGWLRLNFGCPPATLDEALRRLAAGVAAAA